MTLTATDPTAADDLTFRRSRLSIDDLDAVCELAENVCAETLDEWLNDTGRAQYRDRDRWARILTTRHVIGVHETSGQLIATATVHADGDIAHLSSHLVAIRGAGIGRWLVEARLGLARQWGCTRVEAHTHAPNRIAARMLTSAGFTHTATGPNTWADTDLHTWTLEL